MLTSRGWWFLIVVVFLLALGAFALANFTVVPAVLGLTLFAWFTYEWVNFQIKSNAAVSKLKVRRVVLQSGRSTPMLWANVPFTVRVRVRHDSLVTVGYAVIEDRLPAGADILEGGTDETTSIAGGEPVDVTYTLKCPAPGVLRFEGVKVRVADLNGFFYRRVFLRDPVEFLVLPPLVGEEGRHRADKRFNTLPPPGIHRIRRPGSGDELLDLRDYIPGDPPKMIAWKASAKKDKLITKEYESDVPVRCTVFLDTSDAVRLGPPGNTLLTRMAGVAAVVSQASAANRDLVGLCTFDDQAATAMKPARTQTHMISILRKLAEVSALQPGTKGVPPEQLTRRAYPLAHELYPEAMASKTNTMPLSRRWIPLLDKWWGWVILFVMVAPPVLCAYKFASMFNPELPQFPGPVNRAIVDWLATTLNFALRVTRSMSLPWAVRIPVGLLIWQCSLLFPVVLGALFWFIHGARGWFGSRAAELRRRKQLAALFCLQDGTGPDGIERYVHDDEAYAERVGQFLQHHHLRCPVPLYDELGRYRFRCARKADVLADQIVRAVSRARDNELFVVLADLAELGDDLEPLVKACRVARARRHHVMVLVPWPADVPSPDDTANDKKDVEPKRKKRHPDDFFDPEIRHKRITKIVQDNLTRQYHEQFRNMRRLLSGTGATVVRISDGDPVRLVLDRLDRLRGMRGRRGLFVGRGLATGHKSAATTTRGNEEPPMSDDREDDRDTKEMSRKPLTQREVFELFLLDKPLRPYLFGALGSLALLFLILFMNGSDLGAILVAFWGLTGLLFRWIASPVLLVLTLAYFMVFPFALPDPDSLYNNPYQVRETHFLMQDMILVMAALVNLRCTYRVLGVIHLAMPFESALRRKGEHPTRRPTSHIEPSEIGWLLAACAGLVFAGQMLWWLINALDFVPAEGGFPFRWADLNSFARYRRGSREPGEYAAGGSRFFVLTGGLFFGFLLVRLVFGYWRLRVMSAAEGAMVTTDTSWSESHRERVRVETWRIWGRTRAADKEREARRKERDQRRKDDEARAKAARRAEGGRDRRRG